LVLNSELDPDDFIVSSGKSFSIKEFVDETLKLAGYKNFKWVGEGCET
jgi:GDP-D-mannose dehydratase